MKNNWKNKIIYQIYPRSFFDSSGNGIGDLKGIAKKIDYLKRLGVEYIWISPFFKSPQKDFGYDVSNYREVDPIFGTNNDLKNLIEIFHKNNLKIIIDLVLSHTSDQHPWFQKSLLREDNFDDWYVWVDGRKDESPNNWLSVFGGSSWKWSDKRNAFYLHNFLESQPDLNFHNTEVQNQMLDEIKFWLDFGIDGFRFDVINFLFHDKNLRNNPYKDPSEIRPLGFNKDNPYGSQIHKFDNTRPETESFIKKIRSLLDGYGAISIGEIVADNPMDVIARYTSEDKLHMAYCFEFLSDEFEFDKVEGIVDDFFQKNKNSWPCWAFSNHDAKRIASRSSIEPKELMRKLLSLKGNVCIYQGEELGLHETNVDFDDIQDPFGKAFWPEFKGRDGCRTPMPWKKNQKNLGFTRSTPWLKANKNYKNYAVDVQENDPKSMLNLTRKLIMERKIAT